MNKKLTPFDAIAELDSISISVEQISDMFNIVLPALEDECPSFDSRKDVGATEAIYFTKRFPKFYSALDFLNISLIELVSRINETVEKLMARLREEKEEEKNSTDLTSEILCAAHARKPATRYGHCASAGRRTKGE